MPQYPMNRPENNHQPSFSFGMPQSRFVPSWFAVVATTLLSAYLIQKLLLFFGYDTFSTFEKLWNCFVYLMPSKLVFALRPRSTLLTSGDSDDAHGQHAAKSEVLRNVFGLEKLAKAPQRASSEEGVPAGLGNWDNSCYQNSVLQSLASVGSLHSLLDTIKTSVGQDGLTNTTLAALSNLMRDLNNKKANAHHLWTPPKLKSMSSWQQQDAQEYYSKIVDQLEKDIAAVYKVKEPFQYGLEILPNVSIIDAPEALNLRVVNDETAKSALDDMKEDCSSERLSNPLEGLLAQRVGCTRCGYAEGLSLIPFNCMTLPLGREWQYNLKDCLEAFTALEYIEGVECAKCTLLQSRHQLRQLTETLATTEEDDAEVSAREAEQQKMIEARLEAVTEAIRDEDFTDSTLTKKCQIPSRLRVATTKTRQAIVARTPKCLVMHINRSLFDENTGDQLKNYAEVQFGLTLDLTRWCVGNKQKMELGPQPSVVEQWEMDPSRSMIQDQDCFNQQSRHMYGLQAVITHYGRHENGHYICYRKLPTAQSRCASTASTLLDKSEQWWRLSDENVSQVSEEEVLAQGGVFMLFYECVMQDDDLPAIQRETKISDAVTTTESTPAPLAVPIEAAELPQTLVADRSESPSDEARSLSPSHEPECQSAVPTAVQEEPASTAEDITVLDQQPQAVTTVESRTKNMSPPTMRTAGLTPRHSDERSPMNLRMVATL